MKIKQKKGISLIVLVITIIIMIILAAAIILSLNASGVIERANKARQDTDLATKKEAALMALSEYNLLSAANDSTVANMDATTYVRAKLNDKGIDASDITIENGQIVIGGTVVELAGSGASAIAKGVALGEYVAYSPTAATSSTYTTFDDDEKEDVYISTQTGDDALRWRYMGVDASGNALLVADRPTTILLELFEADGWANGPTKLNDLCNELYSSSLGDARSINVDDVNRVLEANPVVEYATNEYDWDEDEVVFAYNEELLTIGEIISQKGEPALTYTQTPEVGKSINDYDVDGYDYDGTTYKASTTDEYKLMFRNVGNTDYISYWLASACTYANFYNGWASFCVYRVGGGFLTSSSMFLSNGISYGEDIFQHVRPVVSLKSNVQFGEKDGNGVWSIS